MPPLTTLNICLGHLAPPTQLSCHADLMIAPAWVAGQRRLAIVEDASFGPAGDTLSEYAQLIWLSEHLHEIAAGFQFVRIFHYRRFTCRKPPAAGKRSNNQPWSFALAESEIRQFDCEFGRSEVAELFNTPIEMTDGVLAQYARVHVLEDLLHFSAFLLQRGILSEVEAAEFLAAKIFIPACNIGVFQPRTYRMIFSVLKAAAHFIDSPYFIRRDGYQRRCGGFLLERLHSFLILKAIESGICEPNYGHNVVVSQNTDVSITC